MNIDEDDAKEMYRILKDIVKYYPYDVRKCYEMRPGGCKECHAIMEAEEIIKDIEGWED